MIVRGCWDSGPPTAVRNINLHRGLTVGLFLVSFLCVGVEECQFLVDMDTQQTSPLYNDLYEYIGIEH